MWIWTLESEEKLYNDQLRKENVIKDTWKPKSIADIMVENPKYAEYKARSQKEQLHNLVKQYFIWWN